MTVQAKSLTARKKRKESFEMDIKRAGSQFYGRLRVCESWTIFQSNMARSALGSPLGVAGRSESFKSVIAGGNHTAQGMSYRVVSVSASPNSLMKLIKEDSLYSGSLAIRFFLAAFIKPATYCPNSVSIADMSVSSF